MTKGETGVIPTLPIEIGLTKRELFAAMAMQGVLANEEESRAVDDTMPFAFNSRETARMCVEFADALIEALNEGKEKP